MTERVMQQVTRHVTQAARRNSAAALRRARDGGQRGSALLIVFVMAAAIAIMLYLEMPIASFEARRQKEQLLIDRGNEYAHGIKLYLRKIGHYPPSMDALENTNRMRFLRHRFKDPFTGENNWRLLHAGPGGMLIDSKVNPLTTNGTNQSGAPGSTSNSPVGSVGSGSSGSSPFGASATGGSTATVFAGFNNNIASASSTGAEVVVPVAPQRGPAIAANGAIPAASGTDASGNPILPLIQPPFDPTIVYANAQSAGAGLPSQGVPGQNLPGQNSSGQSVPGQNLPGQGGQPGGTAASIFPGSQNGSVGGGVPANGTGIGLGQNSTGIGGIGNSSQQRTGGPGQLNSGGLAGVASIAKGHTIKSVNDQTDYSLWEFFYDPSKDPTRIPGAMGGGGVGGVPASTGQAGGVNTQQNSGTSGFNFGGSNTSGTGTGGGLFSTPSGTTATQSGTPPANPSIGAPTSGPQQQPQ